MVMNWWILAALVAYGAGCVSICCVCVWSCIKSTDRSFVHQWTAEQYKHESEEHRGGCATLHQRVKALVESFEQRTAATVPGRVTASILPNGGRTVRLHNPGEDTIEAEVPPVDQLTCGRLHGDGEGCI